MKTSQIKTPFAKEEKTEILNSSQLIPAEKAIQSTDYYCPDCGEVVRRRKSNKGTYHFFHLGNECSGGGLETILHLLTKEVIEQEKQIWLPNCNAHFNVFRPTVTNDGSISIID